MSRADEMIAASAALKPWRDVIEVAFEAGDLLREAFRAKGGPSGKVQHNADCDLVDEYVALAKEQGHLTGIEENAL